METWKNILNKLKENQKLILLIVVSHHGSSPGKQGFKMLVSEDGFLFGSIGGGRTEFSLVEKAKNLLKKGIEAPFFQNQIHRDDEIDSSGMICAGEQLVLFYPLDTQHISTIESIINENKGVLSITAKSFQLAAENRLKDDFIFTQKAENLWKYQENINRKSFVYLIGGGHVGLAVARLFETLDFEVTMFDDRPNLNTFNSNNHSAKKLVINYEDIADFIPERDNTYIVILTHGYQADRLIFSKLLPRNYKYIGLLGSKSKIDAMFRSMIASGCDKEKLQQADAPIGIDINSKTPAEIAVSIAAKIISIKNKK